MYFVFPCPFSKVFRFALTSLRSFLSMADQSRETMKCCQSAQLRVWELGFFAAYYLTRARQVVQDQKVDGRFDSWALVGRGLADVVFWCILGTLNMGDTHQLVDVGAPKIDIQQSLFTHYWVSSSRGRFIKLGGEIGLLRFISKLCAEFGGWETHFPSLTAIKWRPIPIFLTLRLVDPVAP
jgi:hypothetical protein